MNTVEQKTRDAMTEHALATIRGMANAARSKESMSAVISALAYMLGGLSDRYDLDGFRRKAWATLDAVYERPASEVLK